MKPFHRGLVLAALLASGAAHADVEPGQDAAAEPTPSPATRRRPPPHEYGRVVIDNYSRDAALGPVVFEHWLHRAKFTCRLCHVDVGFAMKAGASDVRALDNASGQFCGACHDGQTAFGGKKTFEACSKDRPERLPTTCLRCHSLGESVKPEYDFKRLTANLPRGRFGNGVDWERAELDGIIKPIDHLERVSIKRPKLATRKDFSLHPKWQGMPGIIFSHAKHTAWNGCELCHPEIFVGVKMGATRYSMVENFQGKYCGACHLTVAFPLIDCQRCHSQPVQRSPGRGNQRSPARGSVPAGRGT